MVDDLLETSANSHKEFLLTKDEENEAELWAIENRELDEILEREKTNFG